MRGFRVAVVCLLLTFGGAGGVVASQSAGAVANLRDGSRVHSAGASIWVEQSNSRLAKRMAASSRSRSAHSGQIHPSQRYAVHRSSREFGARKLAGMKGTAGLSFARRPHTIARASRHGAPLETGRTAKALRRLWARRQAWSASPAARKARAVSTSAYTGENATEALATDVTAFPGWIDAPGVQSLDLGRGGKLLRRLGKNQALVLGSNGRTSLAESQLPLLGKAANGKSAPLNLNLVRDGSSFAPASSLVPVLIPQSSAGRLQFPSGFAVRFAEGSPVNASLSKGSAFYANVGGQAGATDAVVQPTPQGAEISYVLRSAASPTSDVLSFELPPGWALRQETDHSGNVQVVTAQGRAVGTILAPSAVDAQGQTVLASYRVKGRSQLVVTVFNHSGSFAYPIAVDPLIADYTAGGEVDWSHVQYDGSFTAATTSPSSTGGVGIQPDSVWEMKASTSYPAGAYAEFRKAAPAGAYIYRLVDSGVDHHAWQSLEFGGIEKNDRSTWESGTWQNETNPASGSGAWHQAGGSLTNTTYQYCVVASCAPSASPGIDTGNYAVFGIQAWNAATQPGSNPAYDDVGDATYYLADAQTPSFSAIAHSGYTPGTWINHAETDTVTATAGVSTGLGMSQLSLQGVSGSPGSAIASCSSPVTSSASPTNPCPETLTGSLTYSTASLPQGSNTLSVVATNAGGNTATKSWPVNIDTTPPVVTVSTPVTAVDDAFISGTATDPPAAGANASSGVNTVAVTATAATTGTAYQVCTTAPVSGGSYGCDWDTSQIPEGSYTVTATATDNAGNSSSSSAVVVIDQSPPQVTVSGPAWDAGDNMETQTTGTLSLTASASDPGDDGGGIATSGVVSIQTYVNGTLYPSGPSASQECAAGGCSLSASGSINLSDLQAGDNYIEVDATDAAGNTGSQEWDIETANEDPSVLDAAVQSYESDFSVSSSEAQSAIAMEDALAPSLPTVEADVGSNFAGWWLDPTTAQLDVGVVASDPQSDSGVQQAQSTLDSQSLGSDVNFVSETSSWDTLVGAQASLDTSLATEEGDGQAWTEIDPTTDAVVENEPATGTDPGSAAASSRKALSRATTHAIAKLHGNRRFAHVKIRLVKVKDYHASSRASSCTTSYNAPAFPDESECTVPVRGGVGIFHALSNGGVMECTSTLTVDVPGWSINDVLTAGHCLKESGGQPGMWYTYRRFSGRALQIGHIETKLPGGPASGYVLEGPDSKFPASEQGDYGVIHVDDSSTTGVPSKHTYVYVPGAKGVAPANDTYRIERAVDPPKGWTVCGSSGITLSTGDHMACGHVTHLHRSTTYTNEGNQQVGNLDESNACLGTGGASGSPLYTAHIGLGIMDATISKCDILFSPMANALSQLGVSLY